MKRRQIRTSGVIFAVIFLISAVLGDGFVYGSKSIRAAVGADESIETTELSVEYGMKLAADAEEETEDFVEDKMEEMEEDIESDDIDDTLADDTEIPGEEPVAAMGSEDEEPEVEPEAVAEAEPEPEPEPIRVDYVIANVETSLNIRTGPSTEDQVLGKLYRGAVATILERGEEWTKITSNGLEGYVSSEFLMFDEEAIHGAEIYGVKTATVDVDALRIRKAPGTDAPVLDLAEKGDRLLVADLSDTDAGEGDTDSDAEGEETIQQLDGWVVIDYKEDVLGYVSADFVTVTVELEEAISIEEEQRILAEKRREAERAAQAARAAEALASAKNTTVGVTNRSAFELSDEDIYLLASVVHMESGNQCHEGKLAVANVVLNRLKSGKWGKSLSSVVYARGQFSGANTGLLQKYMDQGPNEGSMKAAAEAVAGVNNIGNYMFFCANRIADYASYSEFTIIEGHTFYKR